LSDDDDDHYDKPREWAKNKVDEKPPSKGGRRFGNNFPEEANESWYVIMLF
jgi:hypothetical protein